jgi:hypothetical protein
MLLRLRQICSHPALITDPEASLEISLSDNASEYDRAVEALGHHWVQRTVANRADIASKRMAAKLEAPIFTIMKVVHC